MSLLSLVHPEQTLTVPLPQATTKCTVFQKNPTLLEAPYSLRSKVPLTLFRQFVSALEGNAIEITSANFSGLSRLCEEFGFEGLRAKLSKSPPAQETAAEVVEVELCLVNERFRLPAVVLRQTCTAFQTLPLPPHYSVASSVSSEIFGLFSLQSKANQSK
jgi:hypothetical protein